jgi:hypothetical protein
MGMLEVLGAAPLAPVLSMMNLTICGQGQAQMQHSSRCEGYA